jgi:hypothetical protein
VYLSAIENNKSGQNSNIQGASTTRVYTVSDADDDDGDIELVQAVKVTEAGSAEVKYNTSTAITSGQYMRVGTVLTIVDKNGSTTGYYITKSSGTSVGDDETKISTADSDSSTATATYTIKSTDGDLAFAVNRTYTVKVGSETIGTVMGGHTITFDGASTDQYAAETTTTPVLKDTSTNLSYSSSTEKWTYKAVAADESTTAGVIVLQKYVKIDSVTGTNFTVKYGGESGTAVKANDLIKDGTTLTAIADTLTAGDYISYKLNGSDTSTDLSEVGAGSKVTKTIELSAATMTSIAFLIRTPG